MIEETVPFDDSEWVVLEAKDLGKKLKANTEYAEEKSTEGRFVAVRYKVTNKGAKEAHVLDAPKLTDGKGRAYGAIDLEAFYVPEKGKTLGLEVLAPGEAKEAWTVFESPPDAKELKLEIHGLGLFGQKKLVDVGL